MKIENGDWSDSDVQKALNDAFPAPSETYWGILEQRILARINTERLSRGEWWGHFGGWARVGLIAAAATLLISGVAAWRSREARERVAYRELLGTPSPLPILSDVFGEGQTKRDATLRYLLTQ